MRIGILGGTFDPIHNGHMAMARYARDELELDKVLIIPAGKPYFKGNITPYDVRCEMIRIALSGDAAQTEEMPVPDNTGLELSLAESDQDNPTYTYRTLAGLKEIYPDSELYFICGTDVFSSIDKWMKPEEVLRLAVLAVYDRARDGESVNPDGVPDQLSEGIRALKSVYEDARCVILRSRIPGISSTEIRNLASEGRPIDMLVPTAVADYIEAHSLYHNI